MTALGHSQQSVRKATLETLRTFLANMSNSGALITCLIKYGIENDEWRTRRESLDALTKLLTRDTGGFDQAHLVTSLISRLRDVSDTVVQQAIHALIHVKNLIGDESLLSYVKKLSGISRQLFRQYQGRIMSSSEPQPPPAPLQKKASQMSQITPDLNSLSITGSPSWTNLRSAPVQEENVRRSGSIQSLSVKALESQVPLYYGYIPEPLFKQIQNDLDWKARSLAIEDLFHLTQEIADPKLLRADIPGLISFLAKFLHDSNFKMVLTSIHIIGLVIDIVGKDIVSSLSFISSNLIVKLADNKSLIRQAAMKTFIKLMQTLDVSSVMDICMASLTSDNIRIREEIVNIASVALLTFPKTRFNFRRIVQYLYNSLKDSKPRVKFCSMEALAIISSIIGKDNVFQILEELGLDRETTQLLTLRFEDPLLASLTPEGLLQHVAGTRSNAGTPAPQVPVMLSKESSKLFLPRATSHTENPAYSSVSSSPIKDDSFMANQSSIQKPQPSIHRPPDSVNPLLANPSGNWSLQQQTQQLEGPKIPSPEMKRIRSFSETDSNVPAGLTLLPTATPQVKGKSLPKETIQRDMAVEETITKTENLPTNTSIYAPNMKINANSLSKL